MTAQPRALRGRSLPAGLLGVLAVLASLLVLPGSAAAVAPSHSAASAAARGAMPFGVGLRETRDKVRVGPRRLGVQSATFVATERPAGAGHGPAPVAAALAAVVALTGAGRRGAGRRWPAGPPITVVRRAPAATAHLPRSRSPDPRPDHPCSRCPRRRDAAARPFTPVTATA